MTESQTLALSALAFLAAATLLVVTKCGWPRSLAAPGFFIAFYLGPALFVAGIIMLAKQGWRPRLVVATTVSVLANVLFGWSLYLMFYEAFQPFNE